MSTLQYPIGPHTLEHTLTEGRRLELIAQIEDAPSALGAVVERLSHAQLDTPYRPGGWTVRQVVHHMADSHMNAYIRCKLALTEERPTVIAYDQDQWAVLEDGRTLPVGPSLALLTGLHDRWGAMWRALEAAQFARELLHPEHGAMTLDSVLGLYAWHGRHHVAQITALRVREGW
jgi:uncharacterized damage-inducible protein DinB